jgi:hypothetical protein
MSKTGTQIPKSMDHSVVTTFETANHRLLALESSLKEMQRRKLLPKKEFERRLRAIRLLSTEVSRLRLIERETRDRSHEVSGLNLLSRYSPTEQEVSVRYLREKTSLAQVLSKLVAKHHDWIKTLLDGSAGWIKTTLRLSETGRLVARIERWLFNLDDEHFRNNQRIAQITGNQVNDAAITNTTAPNVSGLIALFDETSARHTRVSELREKIAQDELTIVKMRDWLMNEESQLSHTTEDFSPPPPMLTKGAELIAERMAPDFLKSTQDRLSLARRFVETHLQPNTENQNKPILKSGKSPMVTQLPGGHHVH